MKVTPFAALMLLACGCGSSGAPTGSSSSDSTSGTTGSSAAALRQLGQRDADDVSRCRAVARHCGAADASSNPFCAQMTAHCDELEAQLAGVRSEFEQCLAEAAECEQTATDPAACDAARAACGAPAKDFEARRGTTLACSERTESCLGRGMGPRGRRDDGVTDAGVETCDGEALDFVGCCHGQHRGGAEDAGDGHGFGKSLPGFGVFGPGAMHKGFGDREHPNHGAEERDAGRSR